VLCYAANAFPCLRHQCRGGGAALLYPSPCGSKALASTVQEKVLG